MSVAASGLACVRTVAHNAAGLRADPRPMHPDPHRFRATMTELEELTARGELTPSELAERLAAAEAAAGGDPAMVAELGEARTFLGWVASLAELPTVH